MRNRTLLFILCAMTMVCGCRKKPQPIVITPDIQKNHLQRNHIFGEVKLIRTDTYHLTGDSIPLSDTNRLDELLQGRTAGLSSLQRYSSDGFLLDYVKLKTPQDTILRRVCRYDENAQATEWEEFDSTGVLSARGKYLYDRNRFLIGEQVFKGGSDSIVIAFAYSTDGIGNITGSTQSLGDYSLHTTYKYNENGQVCKITEHEPNGSVFKTVKIEYDNYGDEVNRCVYKSGNQMIEYTYNAYSQEGKLLKTIYENKMHNLKETRLFSGYDSHLNWQQEIVVQDNRITSVRKRQIIYYQ